MKNMLSRDKDLQDLQYFLTCSMGAQNSDFTKEHITHKQI